MADNKLLRRTKLVKAALVAVLAIIILMINPTILDINFVLSNPDTIFLSALIAFLGVTALLTSRIRLAIFTEVLIVVSIVIADAIFLPLAIMSFIMSLIFIELLSTSKYYDGYGSALNDAEDEINEVVNAYDAYLLRSATLLIMTLFSAVILVGILPLLTLFLGFFVSFSL